VEADNATETRRRNSGTFPRGGSTKARRKPVGKKGVLGSTVDYWKDAFGSLSAAVGKPFKVTGHFVASRFQSKEKKREEELMKQLQSMPIRQVVVPNSTVLPADVVQIAAKGSGMLGSPLRTDRVQDMARNLKNWYLRKGYVLHSVTGVTLKPETATAEIAVEEPTVSRTPVGINFYKEMVIDEDTGDLMTFREYKEKHKTRRTFGLDRLTMQDLNTTFVETSGRTKPGRIASAMGLRPGNHFQWNRHNWERIARSGIFGKILRAAPRPMQDGTVQLHIMATEAPSRHLEYGVGKSLYTGSWEGELDFEHANLLGGGETLGLSVRRGAKDKEPSVRLRFSDGRLADSGGYDVEIFSEYIEYKGEKHEGRQLSDDDGTDIAMTAMHVYDRDDLFDRKGLTLRVRNPVDPSVIMNSQASASVERTATKTGLHETIASGTAEVGPFLRELPLGARFNFDAIVTNGIRIGTRSTPASNEEEASVSRTLLRPFSTVTATTRQLLPLLGNRRPLILALKHSLTASTRHLPGHVGRAQGTTSNIRGSSPNGPVSTALQGTTELRVPIRLPEKLKTNQDAGVVFFADWLYASKDWSSRFHRKSSIGFGLRKSIQGIPLKYDLSYSKEQKFKAVFGLGRDFVF
jgi:outer membrane protein assembly factor BamA